MNIHEYQGKSILQKYSVTVQRGYVADTAEEAVEVAKKLKAETNTPVFVIKAQIHAGGRGKGTITETGSRGVVIAKDEQAVKEKSAAILGGHLVTLQTKKEGKLVNKVFIAEDMYYPGASEPKEFYMSILLDRAIGRPVIVYSQDGGMNIEDVAHNTPERIFKEAIDPLTGVNDFQCRILKL